MNVPRAKHDQMYRLTPGYHESQRRYRLAHPERVRQNHAAAQRRRRERLKLPDGARGALAGLQRSLMRATEPELIKRLTAAVAGLRALYRLDKPAQAPEAPKPKDHRVGILKSYTAELLQHVDHCDADGRPIGLSVETIRARVLEKYPTVPAGRHRGKPTKCTAKELEKLAAVLRAENVPLPFRLRQRRA